MAKQKCVDSVQFWIGRLQFREEYSDNGDGELLINQGIFIQDYAAEHETHIKLFTDSQLTPKFLREVANTIEARRVSVQEKLGKKYKKKKAGTKK